MTHRSNLKFRATLRQLMADRDLSFRNFETLTAQRADRRLSQSYLNQLATGLSTPTVDNVLTVAEALGIDPMYFREYREHLASERAAELVGRVGFDEVMRRLDGESEA